MICGLQGAGMCLSAVSRRALPSPGPTALSLFPAVFELRSEGSVLAHSAWVDQIEAKRRARHFGWGHKRPAGARLFSGWLGVVVLVLYPTGRGDEHFKSGKEDMEG
ncbi:hypothetical protein MHYP_G00005860 [Metynnis hypsauchen]